ncbi:hypothetical protein Tco_0361263 [Tanacetum coccineum]
MVPPNKLGPDLNGKAVNETQYRDLEDSKVWVSTPTGGVRGDIGYNREIGAKETLKESCLPPRWRLLMGQIIQCLGGKTGGLDQISNKDATILYCLADSIPPQQGMDEGTKNTSYDHIFGASFTAIHGDKKEASTTIHGDKEEASSIIKLEDLAKLVSQIQPSFKDLDSPEDDPVIIIDESDKDEPNAETEETLVPRSSSPRSSQIQELTNQLNELMVKSLQTEFSKILSSHDFSSSLPTELKDFPSKFNELTKEIKGLKTQVYELEIELPKELKEIPTQLEDFTKTATSLTSQVAELKTLYLLLNVIKALNKFVKVLESTSTKAGDQSFPSAGQADTMLAEGEKDTNQATISQLFQRRAEKIVEVEKENLNQ